MKKDNTFIDSLIDAMLEDVQIELRPEHITIRRLMDEAALRGKPISEYKAKRLIEKQVKSGKLKFDGKRINPVTNFPVNAWMVEK